VAAKTGADRHAMEMLLNALTVMGLLTKQQGMFRPAPEAARFFSAGSPENARPALLHIAHLWHARSDLTEAVRTGSAVRHEEMAARGEDWTEASSPRCIATSRNARPT
jgi:hypothetical protein